MRLEVQPDEKCGKYDLICKGKDGAKEWAADQVGDAASSVAGNALQEFANEVKEAVGQVVAEVGTVWLRVPTVDPLSSDGGTAPDVGRGAEPRGGGGGIVEVLGMVSWVALGVCVLSLIVVGARMGIESRRNDGEYHITRVMVVLLAAIFVSAASAITTAVMPDESQGESTVAFIENSLWYYTAAAVVLSILVGGLRMAWEQRADPGKDLIRSLLTFIVVSAGGLTVISLLLQAGDAFSEWIVYESLQCDSEPNAACFGENMTAMLGMSGAAAGVGVIAVIVLGLMAFVASAVQIAMMIARSGMLIVLAGTLPLAASATNTAMGKQMFQKLSGWIIALLLYKPAAAIIYAAAFQLAGTDILGGGLKATGKVIIGLMMMVLAVLALPALMRLVTPAVSALASGNAAGGMAMAAAAAVPMGAVAGGKLMGGGSAAGADGVGSQDSAGSGTGPPGSKGSGGPSGTDSGSDSPSGADSPGGPSGSPQEVGGGEETAGSGVKESAGGGANAGRAAAAGGPVGALAGAASSDEGGPPGLSSAAGGMKGATDAVSGATGAVAAAGQDGVGGSDEQEEGPSGSG